MKSKIAVIAGTSEATELIHMAEENFDITAFTATQQGTEILRECSCTVVQGRLDKEGFLKNLKGFSAVADMSHPFAEIVSETVKTACGELGIPYLRGGRETLDYDYDRIIYADSKEEAAEILKTVKGNIFLTTGVKTLRFYENALHSETDRIWARVLESEESRRLSEGSEVNVIYSVLPVPEGETERIMKEHNISVLVTKDSGIRGGLPEKIKAAKKSGAEVIIINSPEKGICSTPEEIYNRLLRKH